MKALARAIAHRAVPSLMARRANRQCRRTLEKLGLEEIEQEYLKHLQPVVAEGPFQGMQYLATSAGSVLLPKLIGCYELEIQPFVAEMLSQPLDSVIDIGCAEGYYATGFAWKTNAKVFAFDTDRLAQKLTGQLANLNQCKVNIGGSCTPEVLQRTIAGRTLVICDCEGYEYTLLAPDKVPALQECDILVELHGPADPIVQRFTASHRIDLVTSEDRRISAYPSLSFLTPEAQKLALGEFRHGPQTWALLTSK